MDTDIVGDWLPSINREDGPLYLSIADAIAADVASGKLRDGVRLPAQRALAELLGIDFTTVSRAYAEARRRNLIESRVGQGTFVRMPHRRPTEPLPSGMVDMSMNLPPRFENADLATRLWTGIASLEERSGLDLLLRYQEPGGGAADRLGGAQWLSARLPVISAECVLVCPGAQGALLAVAGLLTAPGDTILVEELVYPGFRALAGQLRLRLVALRMDREGLDPEAFDAACRSERPKAIYCTPTMHNPTTATMSLGRRQAVAEVARRHGVPIIEDDAYGPLPRETLPALAALVPEMTYYVGGLAKTLSPALRIAYLAVPDARIAIRVAGAIRATSAMASPVTAAVATRWITDGTAAEVLDAIRAETAARRAIAAQILPSDKVVAHPESFHLWLQLQAPWTRGEFATRLRSAEVGVVMSDAFALSHPPEAVRLGLGAARTREELTHGLQVIADLLDQPPAMSSMVI